MQALPHETKLKDSESAIQFRTCLIRDAETRACVT